MILKACPLCGKPATLCFTHVNHHNHWIVMCTHDICEASTPALHTYEEAINLWEDQDFRLSLPRRIWEQP
jgi:hypothetical protein